MRAIHLVSALAATLGIALADVAGYPDCAVKCVLDALPYSHCPGLNETCLCTDVAFNKAAVPCVKAICTVKEQFKIAQVSASRCGETVPENKIMPRVLTAVIFALPTVFLAIRITNKIVNPSFWGADDVTVLLGFGCTIGLLVIIYRSLAIGLGSVIWTLHFNDVTEFLRMLFATQVLYLTGLAAIKASILFFYLRIFPSSGFRKILWATQAFNGLVGFVYLIVSFCQCRPLSLYWLGWGTNTGQVCLSFNKVLLTHAGFQLGLDVWMLILPLTQLYKLNLPWKKRIGAMLMFSIGIFLTVVSAIRIEPMIRLMTVTNLTSEALWVYIWTYTELCVGVSVCCMPSASKLWRTLFRKVKDSRADSKLKNSSSSATEMESLSRGTKKSAPSLGSCTETKMAEVAHEVV